jgi:hypothetical protein
MRGAEALLIAAFIGLIGMGVWNVRQWLPDWAFGETRYVPADASKLATGLADKEEAKTSRIRGKRGDRSGRVSATSDISIDQLPVSTTVVDVPASGFPTGKDLPVGTSSNQIRSQYGEPTASVTATRGGRVFEYYYYFNKDRTKLTKATLESGVIVSAETTLP